MRHRTLTVAGLGAVFGLVGSGCNTAPTGTRFHAGTADANDCMEGARAQFGRYIGDWQIEDESLQRDGSGWAKGPGARWVFQCIGDGTAVQDYWLPNGGGFGTNLRRYNEERNVWEIIWTANPLPGLQHIEAERQADDTILMTIITPAPNPPRRIIFFPPTADGWDWVQQMSFDDGSTWTDVYRIRATPYSGPD